MNFTYFVSRGQLIHPAPDGFHNARTVSPWNQGESSLARVTAGGLLPFGQHLVSVAVYHHRIQGVDTGRLNYYFLILMSS